MKPALLFYCQHSVGLGHLMRSYALCEALARALPRRAAGRRRAARRHRPAGATSSSSRCRRSASSPATGFGSGDPRYTTERAWAVRAERIQTTLRTHAARRSCSSSCSRSGARSSPASSSRCSSRRATLGAFTACSLRDILVSTRANQREHDDRAAALANAHLDAVLVHCDPRFARLEETFKPSTPLRVPVHYTGFVTRNGDGARAPRRAHRRLRRRRTRRRAAARGGDASASNGRPMRAIAGPLMPDEDYERAPATLKPGQRRARPLRPGPGARAEQRRGPASASAATTPRSTSCAPASPRSSSPTRRPRRTSRPAARAAWSSSAPSRWRRTSTATSTRCSSSRRAPRRSTSTARPRPASCCRERRREALRPYVLRQWRALLGASAEHRPWSPPPSWPSRGRSR